VLQVADSCRFGVFEVNLQAREVRKHGTRVRLSGHAFEILALLLERPGEIVTREQLRMRLWPADTFVDFEHGLNTAVKKLRAALGDSPENSRYIETIPRHGYRFVAPVESLRVRKDAVSTTNKTSASSLPRHEQESASRSRAVTLWAVPAAFIVFLSPLLALAFLPYKPPHVTSTTRLTRSGRVDDWGSLATDGARIYYLEREGAHWNLMQTSAQGGNPQAVGIAFPGANAQILDISRDLSQMLVSTFVMRETEMPLWVLPIQGGAPHRVGNIKTKYAAWTPDGKQILYSHDKDLMIADADGKNSRTLVTASGRIYDLSVSPNGKSFRFSLENPHTTNGEIWEVSVDGRDLRRLFANWTRPLGECCGRWTPDGRYYTFLAWQGERLGVWAVREKQGLYFWKHPSPINLISGPSQVGRIIPDRDGRKIFAIGQNLEGDMMRYDQKQRALVSVPGLPPNSRVFYSPTREWILYQNDSDFSLWRSKADGSQPLQLTRPLLRIADPQWSPDATQIVFMGPGEGPNQGTQVYLLPRDGGEPRRLFRESGSQSHPHWLPDGKSIAISVSPVEGEKQPTPGIYVTNVATEQAYKLPESQDIDGAEWSPNGRFVLGVTNDFHRIKLYDIWKNKWAQLVTATLVSGPSWAPDSQSIYYQDILEEDQPIYRHWLSGRRREKVYDFHKELNSGYFRCVLYGIRSDGSLLVRLSRSYADLYAFEVDFP
jgi:Tol biopolymer transport system component/DNA-binding winged helix-turn-helix (wHTH) protein